MNADNHQWPPENASPGDKWTGFWMSVVVPGAGQLWGALRAIRRRPWRRTVHQLLAGAAWLSAAAGVAVVSSRWLTDWPLLGGSLYLLLGLAAGVHAKRLLEPQRKNPHRRGSSCSCPPQKGRRIAARIELEFVEPAEQLWKRISDLPAFLTIDPFHDRVALMRPEPKAGVDLVLSHNAFGHRVLRFGRIMRWTPGRGYAFSDLSRLGGGSGFPHVFYVDVTPVGDTACKLTIDVRGKWTSVIIPAVLGRFWIHWVCREHVRLLAKAL